MVRSPCFDSNGMKKGAWSKEEDNKLRAFVLTYGHWNWRLLPKYAGLKRCGKSCRLRWVNHLKPGVKRGNFSKEEEDLIIKLHTQLGNKWSAIAAELPGRTDNDIKNFWHTRISPRRKPNRPPNEEVSPIDPNQSADSFDATNLIKFDADSLVVPVAAPPRTNLGFDEFAEDRNGGGFPPLMDEEFCYSEVNYQSDLSNESLNIDVLDWIRDCDAVQGSIWEESYGLSSLEGTGGFFDPVFCLWN